MTQIKQIITDFNLSAKISQIRVIRVLLFSILFLISLTSYSQKLSLDSCISIAIENNISIEKEREKIKQNYIDIEQAKYNLLPNLYSTIEHNYNFAKVLNATNNNLENNGQQTNKFLLTSELVLFNGLKNLKLITDKKLKHKISKFEKQKI